MAKIRAFMNKYQDMIAYLIFGVLTTVVNFLVYIPLYRYLNFSAAWANAVAWIAAVAFAFVTNKPFVFKSNDWSVRVVFPELGKFVGSRVFSGLLETVILAVTVDMLQWNALVMKVITAVLVVILNYVASRWIVFAKKTDSRNN